MNMRFARRLLFATAAAVLMLSCSVGGRPTADVSTVMVGGADQQTNLLGECAKPYISVGAPGTGSVIGRSTAERAAGAMGVRGSADIAMLRNVTIGTRNDAAPTVANAQRDSSGVAVIDRPAWVMVFRNQSVPTPGGPLVRASNAAPPRPLTVLGAVVDATSGELLRGWGCVR